MTSSGQGRGRGYAYALGAYTIWGLIPAYFKLLTKAPPLEPLKTSGCNASAGAGKAAGSSLFGALGLATALGLALGRRRRR